MKRRDRQTIDTLQKQFQNYSETVSVPKDLEPQHMKQIFRTAQSVPKKQKKTLELSHIAAAVAAMIVLIIGAALLVPQSQKNIITTVTGSLEHAKQHRSDERMRAAQDYSEITAVINTMSQQAKSGETSGFFDRLWNWAIPESKQAADGAIPESDNSDTLQKAQATAEEDAAFGKTNVQVAGIDEADILKNDGKYLYLATQREVTKELRAGETIYMREPAVQIIALGEGGQMQNVATIVPSVKTDRTICGLFIHADTLAVIYHDARDSKHSEINGNDMETTGGLATHCDIYDITDRSNPQLKKQLTQDGAYLSARLIGTQLLLVTNHSIYESLYRDDFDPQTDGIPRCGVDGETTTFPAQDIYIAQTEPEPGYLIVSMYSLDRMPEKPQQAAVLGAGENVYCSGENLYVARTVYTSRADTYRTELYRFSLEDGKPVYAASGEVPGSLLSQFSMDEYKEHVRIATTQSDDKLSSNLFVLGLDLKPIGEIRNIAPDEQIQSVRFVGDTGYLVTFAQVDPLFVADLSDPKSPKILGELKIPGFSSYLHPISKNLLLGIGYPGDDAGTTQGIKLSLFDVSNPQKPAEVDSKTIRSSDQIYVSSSAQHDHKAFLYDDANKIFGFIVRREEYTDRNYMNLIQSASAHTYTVDTAKKKIVPQPIYAMATGNSSSEHLLSDDRLTYVDDIFYACSGNQISAFRYGEAKALATLKLAQS